MLRVVRLDSRFTAFRIYFDWKNKYTQCYGLYIFFCRLQYKWHTIKTKFDYVIVCWQPLILKCFRLTAFWLVFVVLPDASDIIQFTLLPHEILNTNVPYFSFCVCFYLRFFLFLFWIVSFFILFLFYFKHNFYWSFDGRLLIAQSATAKMERFFDPGEMLSTFLANYMKWLANCGWVIEEINHSSP